MNENNWASRWSTDQIQTILHEQFDNFWQKSLGISRFKLKDAEKAIHIPHAVIISGLRRVGKSTLLAQIAHKLGNESYYYLNFEDERFIGFSVEDFNDLYQTLVELFGERKIFIMDEIQNVLGWEHFVRRFMDMDFKFFITGSNASLLSRELGNRLTGRYISIELFPFSFKEYLEFSGETIPNFSRMATVEYAKMNTLFLQYSNQGGIPDALKYPELSLNHALYQDILYRDIAARYNLDAVNALKELAFFLISNPAGLVSYNKLKERLKLGSVNTVTSYIDYLENSWLLFSINKYAYSIKRQQIAPKKIYAIDTGMINEVGFGFSANTGKLLENIVFIALRQRIKDIYYYVSQQGHEVDFYLPERRQLIQVSYRIDQKETREREFRALIEAGKELEIEKAIVLCNKNERPQIIDKMKIEIKSISEWLIHQES